MAGIGFGDDLVGGVHIGPIAARARFIKRRTLTDLQYQQILNNLAMFSQNPSALPSHVNVRDGSAQVADAGSRHLLAVGQCRQPPPSLFGSRTIVEQWGMSPVTDDTELRLLHLAYRRALGFPDRLEDDHYDLANDIAHELKKQTPDFNEFQDQIDRTFNDGKERYRNEQFKILAEAASSRKWKSLPMFLLFGNTYGLGATIANVFFPYEYSISLYQSITEDDVKLVSQFEPLSLKFDTAEDFLQFKKGIQTVLIADVKGKLYLRIFAADGEPMLTTNEDELPYRKSELLKLKAGLQSRELGSARQHAGRQGSSDGRREIHRRWSPDR